MYLPAARPSIFNNCISDWPVVAKAQDVLATPCILKLCTTTPRAATARDVVYVCGGLLLQRGLLPHPARGAPRIRADRPRRVRAPPVRGDAARRCVPTAPGRRRPRARRGRPSSRPAARAAATAPMMITTLCLFYYSSRYPFAAREACFTTRNLHIFGFVPSARRACGRDAR